MNRTARKIIMIVAASVFVFSSAMVLKDYLQMKAAAEFSESISEMVVDLPTEENDYEMIYSDFDSTAILTSEHTVITLSTCSYEYSNARYVIIAVLEKL